MDRTQKLLGTTPRSSSPVTPVSLVVLRCPPTSLHSPLRLSVPPTSPSDLSIRNRSPTTSVVSHIPSHTVVPRCLCGDMGPFPPNLGPGPVSEVGVVRKSLVQKGPRYSLQLSSSYFSGLTRFMEESRPLCPSEDYVPSSTPTLKREGED